MADRSAARILGRAFAVLAEQPDDRAKALARRLWDLTKGADFDPSQMGANEALLALGLGRYRVDTNYPEDGERLHLGPEGDDA
jgi:hypothetical protein